MRALSKQNIFLEFTWEFVVDEAPCLSLDNETVVVLSSRVPLILWRAFNVAIKVFE